MMLQECTDGLRNNDKHITVAELMRFVKEEDRAWYVDLPDYPGSHADLLMVCGADLLLEMICSDGSSVVEMLVDTEPFEGHTTELILTREEAGGGWYDMMSNAVGGPYVWPVWLCKVVKYVFDGLPETIYFKEVIKNDDTEN